MQRAIALGFFDGVHLGHQALVRRTVERGAERGFLPAVFTFDRSPREFVTGLPVPLLTTAEERRRAVESLFPGTEVIVAPFDRAMMTMGWEDFVRMLVRRYQAGWLVAGHDFRFGHKNAGTPKLLERMAADLYGAGCRVEFLRMLRPERRFESLEDLRAQIARDAEAARAFLAG